MNEKTIHLIYPENETDLGEQLAKLLQNEFGNEVARNPGYLKFVSQANIEMESAIILISDDVICDLVWQSNVRSLPEGIRIIPVGSMTIADYSDEGIIPARISEINYIKLDEYVFDNVKEALTTPLDFYELKNSLMLLATSWEASGRSDDELMSGFRKTRTALKEVQRKRRGNVVDANLNNQLEYMEYFLKLSDSRNKREFITRLPSILGTCFSLFILIAGLLTMAILTPEHIRANIGNASLQYETTPERASEDAIIALDGIKNDTIPEIAKEALFDEIVACLDMNWPNTIIGGAYKWATNDTALTNSPQYLWTANGNGEMTRWDTHTGSIVEHEMVSDNPLIACETSEDNSVMLAVDNSGVVFVNNGTGVWIPIPKKTIVDKYEDVEIMISDDNKAFSIHDAHTLDVYRLDSISPQLLVEGTYDNVLAVAMGSDENWTLFTSDGNSIAIDRYNSGKLINTNTISVNVNFACDADANENSLVFCDSKGQVLILTIEGEIVSTGIKLQSPRHLAFLDDTILVYYDENSGTHVYDYDTKIDLGMCLQNASGADDLKAHGSTVCIMHNKNYFSQDISAMIPIRALNISNANDYSGISSDSGNCIDSLDLRDGSILIVTISNNDEEIKLVIDGNKRVTAGSAQFNQSDFFSGEMGFKFDPTLQVDYNGFITLARITRQIDGIKDVLSIGTSDGCYYEILFSPDLEAKVISRKKIPNNAMIESVSISNDECYLHDNEGFYWISRLGVDRDDVEMLTRQVKKKITQAFGRDIYDTVSEETANDLQLLEAPGSDGVIWE